MTDSRGCVILAGGYGSRLGGLNKAVLELGNARIIDRLLTTVCPLVTDIRLVVNDNSLADTGIPLVLDPEPHAGVLPALLTGLSASHSELCLVVACDMPFLSGALVSHLFNRCEASDVCLPYTQGRPEPMLAVYRREPCIAAISHSIRQERMRMISFLDDVRVTQIEENELRLFDPTLQSFFNINEPVDLEKAQRIAAHSA